MRSNISLRETQQLVSQLVAMIEKLKPKQGAIPVEWNDVQTQLYSDLNSAPSISNDNEVICALALFAAKLTDSNALRFFTQCFSKGIGNSHALWFSLIALEYEKQNSFISSINIFENAKENKADPSAFLELKYSDFKKRMIKRFQSGETLNLGTYENIVYTYVNGAISTTDTNGVPCHPAQDIFRLIGYTPNHTSYLSINNSNNISKQEHYIPGYTPDLLIGPDEKECSFEEQRLMSLGYDFIANRILDANIVNSNKVSINSNHDKNNNINFVNISSTNINDNNNNNVFLVNDNNDFFNNNSKQNNSYINNESAELTSKAGGLPILQKKVNTSRFTSFTNDAEQPAPILKKGPSPRSSSKLNVTFNQNALANLSDKRRPPTPISKRVIFINETIPTDAGNIFIESQIGEHAYLGSGSKDSYVLKSYTRTFNEFIPIHKEFFALNIVDVPDFYISHFYSNGNLEKSIDVIRGKRPDQYVILFFFLQMLLIIQDLEEKKMYHNEITEKNLLLRTSANELSKNFGMNEIGWNETGLVLCRCDKVSAENTQSDREAAYKLFIRMATNSDFSGEQIECPGRWDKNIWKLAYDTLYSNDSLDPLEALIIKELAKNSPNLRSKIARIVCSL